MCSDRIVRIVKAFAEPIFHLTNSTAAGGCQARTFLICPGHVKTVMAEKCSGATSAIDQDLFLQRIFGLRKCKD